MRLSVDLAT